MTYITVRQALVTNITKKRQSVQNRVNKIIYTNYHRTSNNKTILTSHGLSFIHKNNTK